MYKRQRFSGASDHLVSEALYLDDPEGNGIELYRDRPRSDWRWAGSEVQMDTLALDLDGLLGELDGATTADAGMPAGTRLGHVHVQVGSLAQADAFWHAAVGFAVTASTYPGALFMGAGGYHHHLGLNVWAGAGAPPPPAGALGIRHFEVVLADGAERDRLVARLAASGHAAEETADGLVVRDASGTTAILRG